MSFFEIEPMGARHYGGINVGGINVGGMYGGAKKGTKLTEDQKGRLLLGKEQARLRIANIADEIRASQNVSPRVAMAMARDIDMANRPSGRVKLTPTQKLQRLEARLKPDYVPPPRRAPSRMASTKARISMGRKGSALTGKKMTIEDLEALESFLQENGYGLHDLEGCGFFDDIWSGIKNVGSTALHLAPHLLPLI